MAHLGRQSLFDHCTWRNRFGIPVVCNKRKIEVNFKDEGHNKSAQAWNAVYGVLRQATLRAASYTDRIKFIEDWLLPSKWKRDTATSISEEPGRSVKEEIHHLAELMVYLHRMLHDLEIGLTRCCDYGVSFVKEPSTPRTIDNPFEFLHRPRIFLRRWGPDSQVNLDQTYGFLAGNWRSLEPASTFEELMDRGGLTIRDLKYHCEGISVATPWISMIDDPVWMLKDTNKKYPLDSSKSGGIRVSAISVARLNRLNVLFNRSNELVQQAGGRRWNGKWQVHGREHHKVCLGVALSGVRMDSISMRACDVDDRRVPCPVRGGRHQDRSVVSLS